MSIGENVRRPLNVSANDWLQVDDGNTWHLEGANATVTLNERAYELIRLDILTFQLRPGEKTSERQLSSRYGLGMAAVRPGRPVIRSMASVDVRVHH